MCDELSDEEKWFFPYDAFFPARFDPPDPKELVLSKREYLHYPTVKPADKLTHRCDECGGMLVSRRCLACHPLARFYEAQDKASDAITEADEPFWDQRIAEETAKMRKAKQDAGNGCKPTPGKAGTRLEGNRRKSKHSSA